MNKILIIENIEKDYSWRLIELSNYKNAVNSERNIKTQNAQLRAGLALLYAHWEGFIKYSANLYFNYVINQKHKIEDLNFAFIGLLYKSDLKTFSESNKIKKQEEFIKGIFNNLNNIANFPSNDPFKTSNLNFEIFEDICILLSIDINEFTLRYKRNYDKHLESVINEDLVKNRNKIAHGNYLIIKLKEFNIMYDIVINGLLRNFNDLVIESIYQKKYLK